MPDERLPTFLLGALVGVLVGGLVVAGAGAWLVPTERTASPAASMTTATGCASDPATGGWVGQVTTAEDAVVVFNYTLVHDAAEIDVRGDLQNPAEGRHVFAITTAPVTDGEKGSPPDDCQPRTTIQAGVTLPRESGTLAIAIDGDVVATVESDPGAGPSFRPVDAPSDAA